MWSIALVSSGDEVVVYIDAVFSVHAVAFLLVGTGFPTFVI